MNGAVQSVYKLHIQHVLADKRVLAMVKKMAADEAAVEETNASTEDEIIYVRLTLITMHITSAVH